MIGKSKETGEKKGQFLDLSNLTKRQLMELEACVNCGECAVWCPVYQQDKREEITPRGKARFMRRLLRQQYGTLSRIFTKKVDKDEFLVFVKNQYECSTCRQCHFVCPLRIDTVELWEAIREAIVAAGYGPMENQIPLIMSARNNDNPWQQPRATRDRWVKVAKRERKWNKLPKDANKEKVKVLYFVGCTASYDINIKQVAINTVEIFDKLGIDFGILGKKEKCCGSVMLRMGDPEFRRLATENIETFNSLGIEILVTSCAGCFKTIKNDYPKVGELKFEVLHTAELLTRLLDEGKLKFDRELDLTVTYHDPCHLGRHSGVYDDPRKVIKAIPGVKLVEMERYGPNSLCCGAGGGLKAGYPDIQAKMAIERVKQAEATGATHFVQTCPFCFQALQAAAVACNSSIKVIDLTELVNMALGDSSN